MNNNYHHCVLVLHIICVYLETEKNIFVLTADEEKGLELDRRDEGLSCSLPKMQDNIAAV